jgi:hypothetical protein
MATPETGQNPSAPPLEKILEEQAYMLGMSAYLWGYTMNELYRLRSNFLAARHSVGLNRWEHFRDLIGPESAHRLGVVRPSPATLYSNAWLDLSLEPFVLEFPQIQDRYVTFNYIGYFQDIGNLSDASGGRAYAFVGPNWEGTLPDGVDRLNLASNAVWLNARTEVKGPDDVNNAHPLQDQYSLTALSEYVAGKRNSTGAHVYPQWTTFAVNEPLNWFARLNEGLRHNPPQDADVVMLGLFETLNIGPGRTFDPTRLDTGTAAGLRRAVDIGPQILEQYFKTRLGAHENGWQLISDRSSERTADIDRLDFLRRAAIAKCVPPGQDPREAVCRIACFDRTGQPLDAGNRYVMRFSKGELPTAKAVWSLSVYDAEGFPIKNPINRYHLGTYDDLKTDADGALTIYIQHDSPGKDKESNWLPAPAEGAFDVTMRLCDPESAAAMPEWVPPGIEAQSASAQDQAA